MRARSVGATAPPTRPLIGITPVSLVDIEVDSDPEESPPSTPVAHPDSSKLPAVSEGGAGADKRDGTLILLDWDDTINPSSLVTSLGFRIDEDSELPPTLQQELEALEEIAIDMLETCSAHGQVIIVTKVCPLGPRLKRAGYIPHIPSK